MAGIMLRNMEAPTIRRILGDYFVPILLPGAVFFAVFMGVLYLPMGGFSEAARISQVVLNLLDAALVIGMMAIFSFSLRYFRARGFYFTLLLIIQMWFFQQEELTNGAYWTFIFIPWAFAVFMFARERGIFSPHTRFLLLIIGLPVLLRFLLEQYAGLPLTRWAASLDLVPPDTKLAQLGVSSWSLFLYGGAVSMGIIRYILRPGRDMAAVLWILVISLVMIRMAGMESYPELVTAGLEGNELTPEFMFMAGEGVEPGLHGFLALAVFTAAILEVVTLFDISYRMAYQDQLTELPGRRAFDDALSNLGKKYSIVMVDVDKFKSFNDSYGHDVGDQVLKMVARIMAAHARPGTAYRYGGEEFVLLFPGLDAGEAARHADSIRQKIASYPFALRKFFRPYRHSPKGRSGGPKEKTGGRKIPQAKGKGNTDSRSRNQVPKTVNITVSMGLSRRDDSSENASAVLKRADQALYAAKDGGRNRLVVSKG